MKSISLLSFIIGCLFPLMSIAQITVSPEVGVSYQPFTLYGANTINKSQRLDLLIGLSAQLPFHKNWYLNTRISYSNREDIKWMDLCTCPLYEYSQFKHSDLNIDFAFMFEKANWLKMGGGPSLISKFAESEIVDGSLENMGVIRTTNQFLFGASLRTTFTIEKINFHLGYTRLINDLPTYVSNNRFDFSVSYLIGAKK